MNSTFQNIPESKQQKIIKVALSNFAEQGYENASTNTIIKQLGISKGSLFKYFSTKLELYEYLVNHAVAKLLSYLDSQVIIGDNWRERLLCYAGIEYDFLISEPIIYKFFYRMINELEHPQLTAIKKDLLEQSGKYLVKIFNAIELPQHAGELHRNHISFILKGYNDYFINKLHANNISDIKKQEYLLGLRNHLNLIGGI